MTQIHTCKPVGKLEIAALLGVLPDTVSTWWRRSRLGTLPAPMPAPRWKVSGEDAWDEADIIEWDQARRAHPIRRRSAG